MLSKTYIRGVKFCVFLKLSHDAGLYYSLFLSSVWQFCPFCHTAFHAYEELYKIYYYLLLYASLNPSLLLHLPVQRNDWLIH